MTNRLVAALLLALVAPAALADDIVPPAAAGTDGPAVLRGTGITAHPVAEITPEPRFDAFAGRHLWLVDVPRDLVIGCRIEATTQVEEYRIRCVEDRLSLR